MLKGYGFSGMTRHSKAMPLEAVIKAEAARGKSRTPIESDEADKC
jgi:hypothetical protein